MMGPRLTVALLPLAVLVEDHGESQHVTITDRKKWLSSFLLVGIAHHFRLFIILL
jgi:hypothetical protein